MSNQQKCPPVLGQALNRAELERWFKNVERLEDIAGSWTYRVQDQYGNDAGMIQYGKWAESWLFFVDNFPAEKKYYQTDLPMMTVGDMQRDATRAGLELVLREEVTGDEY